MMDDIFDDIYMNPKERNITGRYYYTLWYNNATGYAAKFLTSVQEAIETSAFPEILVERKTFHTGGCYLLGKQWDYGTEKVQSFDGFVFHSLRPDLAAQRCVYKASEFGNILHVSIIFYTELPGCSGSKPGCSDMRKGLLDHEYEEVFERLVWMIVEEATRRLGDEPLHTEKSEREKSGGKSGLGGLLNKLPI